ncbi:MAG: hypothetical protein U0559_01535 [Anaerolineae bacterium]
MNCICPLKLEPAPLRIVQEALTNIRKHANATQANSVCAPMLITWS